MFRISNFAAMDYNEQTEYLQEFLAEIDARSSMRYAREQGLKEGREEGIAEGRAEGIAEGRAEGIAEGRAEVLLETARAMKTEGEPVEKIIRYTGLSAEEIEKL